MLVAHLIDAAAGEGGALACAAAVAGSPPDVDHRVVAVGPDWVEARARELGLGIDARATAGRSQLARARALRGVLGTIAPKFDALHAWSLTMAAAADRAGFGQRIVVSGSPPAEPADWLATPTIAAWPWQSLDAWRAAGAVDIRELPAPDLRSPWAGADEYEAVRADLGIEPEDEAVALIADPAADGDARRFVYLLGLLHVGGRRIIGLVPEGCSALDRAARYTRAHGRRWGLIPVRGPMCRALAAADLAALDDARPDNSGLLALTARAAGVPVVHIGPGPAAPEIARHTAAAAIEFLDRRHERRLPAPTTDSAFATTITEIWRDAAAALHAS